MWIVYVDGHRRFSNAALDFPPIAANIIHISVFGKNCIANDSVIVVSPRVDLYGIPIRYRENFKKKLNIFRGSPT